MVLLILWGQNLTNMFRKDQYKHKADTVEAFKDKRRNQEISLRKDKRDKLIQAKRFRHSEDLDEDAGHSFTTEQVTNLTKQLQHGSTNKLKDLQTLRQACSKGSTYIEAFFKVDNALPCLVGLLTGHDTELQYEAAWCLTNISAGTQDHALSIVKSAAPYLITFLSSSSHMLQDQCAWALGNLAGDGPECRELLCKQGIVVPLVRLLQSPVPAVVQSSAFALSNITRESTEITNEIVKAGVIDSLPQYLHLKPDNRNILAEISWILTYLTTSGDHVPALINLGILSSIVTILVKLVSEEKHDAQTVTPLLRCLGNICSGPDEYSLLACENPRLLHTLGQYLNSPVRHIVKESLWVFSNLAGVPSIATSIVYSPLLVQVIDKLNGGFNIQHEALYVLNNIACHGPEACDCLLEKKVLQNVIPILKSPDVELLNLSLALCETILQLTEAGYHIFESSEGVARLEGLEYHSNTSIAAKANELLDTYFLINTEEGDD